MKPRKAPEPVRAALRALVRGFPQKAVTHVASLKNAVSAEATNRQVALFIKTLVDDRPSRRRRLWYQSFLKQPANPEAIATRYQPFQYWSQGSPPDDVAHLTDLWNSLMQGIGLPTIVVFDKLSADSWMRSQCPELLGAFRSAYDYAAEADVFRVAYASRCDCIWIDADLYPKSGVVSLLRSRLQDYDLVFYFRWSSPWISNAFFCSKASSPFFRDFAEQMKDYRYSEESPGQREIMRAFGPARYNSLLGSIIKNEGSELNRPYGLRRVEHRGEYSIGFVNEYTFASMSPPGELQYKKTPDYWKNRWE